MWVRVRHLKLGFYRSLSLYPKRLVRMLMMTNRKIIQTMMVFPCSTISSNITDRPPVNVDFRAVSQKSQENHITLTHDLAYIKYRASEIMKQLRLRRTTK